MNQLQRRRRKFFRKSLLKAIMILIIPPSFFWLLKEIFIPSDTFLKSLGWFGGSAIATWATLVIAWTTDAFGINISQVIGWDVLQIFDAVGKITERTLKGIRDELHIVGRLSRVEIQEIWGQLEQKRPVLIEGKSGCGKSGIAAAIVRKAQGHGIPTLFLDTRHYSEAVIAFGDLEKYVGVTIPLRDCLEKLACNFGDCLLVIDQMDSAIGTRAYQVSTELLAFASSLENVNVVAVSCVSDQSEYQPIRDLSFHTIVSEPLHREKIIALLRQVNITQPSESLVELAQNFFFLSVMMELCEEVDLTQVEGEIALLEKYRRTLQQQEKEDIVSKAVDLAYEHLPVGKRDFRIPQKLDKVLSRLQNCNIIVPVEEGLYRFRHEQLLFYFYALGAIEKAESISEMLTRVAGCYVEMALVWVLRIFYYRRSQRLTTFLETALGQESPLSFYEKAALIDEIAMWTDPGSHQGAVTTIVEIISKDRSLESYFFRHLAEEKNLAWFDPLKRLGIFDVAPTPETSGQIWSPILYLGGIVPQYSKQVTDVAAQLETQNLNVMYELLRVTGQMPPTEVVQMIPVILRWAEQGLPLENTIVDLVAYLTSAEQWETALQLVDLMLRPVIPSGKELDTYSYLQVTSQADIYFTRALVNRVFPLLLHRCPLDILRIAQANLDIATDTTLWGNVYSYHGRRSIEPHVQNLSGGLVDLLIDVTVRALNAVVIADLDQGRSIIQMYLEHPHALRRRIAIHTIRVHTKLLPDLTQRLFTDPRYLDDRSISHEYWLFTHEAFESTSLQIQNVFIESLLNKILQAQAETDNEMRDILCYRRLQQLWAVKDYHLSDKAREVLGNLINDYGEPENPDFLPSFTSDSVETESSRSSEELLDLSVEEILAELKTDFPSGFLKDAIVKSPQHFETLAPRLINAGIDAIYTENALRGFCDAWKSGKAFDWAPVLALCEAVAKTKDEVIEDDERIQGLQFPATYTNWRTSYVGSYNAVAELLEVGVVQDEHSIPNHFLGKVRDILLNLVDVPGYSPEYERRQAANIPYGMMDLAINVPRGKSMRALVHYAFHLARISKDVPDEQRIAGFVCGTLMEPEVTDKFTEKLNKDIDPSLTGHYTLGRYLPNLHYLNANWLLDHLEDIFPRSPEMLEYWEVAWEGYLHCRQFFLDVYEALKPYYNYALERMAVENQRGNEDIYTRGQFAEHLALLYWEGIETLAQPDSLIPMFFDCASDQERYAFVNSIAAWINKHKPEADSVKWQRVKSLWETRFEVFQRIIEYPDALKNYRQELRAFGTWLPLIPDDLADYYEGLTWALLASENGEIHQQFEFITSLADTHLGFVVTLLKELVQQDRDRWFWLEPKLQTGVRNILESALHSDNTQAKNDAVEIINAFGANDNDRYKDLLDSLKPF